MAITACTPGALEETTLFEEAEARYAYGDYEGATRLYQNFLQLHPMSPLADIAQQRLRTVERELDAIMGRRGAPAPLYVNPAQTPSLPSDSDEGFTHISAPTIPTFRP